MTLVAVRPARGHWSVLCFAEGDEIRIDKSVWEESPYGVGCSLTAEQITALCALSERRRAESRAVFLLSQRDLSRRELEEKLCRERGRYHPENRSAAVQAVERMAELGYVNDTAYAARTAERLWRGKGYPRRRIEEELCRRGIDRDTARDAVAALPVDDGELALAFLAKKRYTVPQSPQERQRIAGALLRYGFDGEVVRRVLSTWQEEESQDE